jgi:AraC-like DNA-binding protein
LTFDDIDLTLATARAPGGESKTVRGKPLISVSSAGGLVEAIQAGGADPDRILRSRGLDRATLSARDGFIPAVDFAAILNEAAHATGDRTFGLHFGAGCNPKNLGPLTYVALNSPTIGTAFDNLGRYIGLHNEAATVSLTADGGVVYAQYELADLGVDLRQHNEYALAVGLNLMRLMAGSDWSPVEVQFAHKAPPETAEHLRIFGAPVSFGRASNAFVVEREFVERQVPAADERLYPVLKRYLDRVLREMPRESSLLASIRRAVGASLRGGDPKLGAVAATLGVSARTLQRQIREHGLEFKTLVDDTRRRFSLTYLRDRKNTLTEIAYLLGYSEVSAFNRAFKRWTGDTPSHHRRQARGAARRGRAASRRARPLRPRPPRSPRAPAGA